MKYGYIKLRIIYKYEEQKVKFFLIRNVMEGFKVLKMYLNLMLERLENNKDFFFLSIVVNRFRFCFVYICIYYNISRLLFLVCVRVCV